MNSLYKAIEKKVLSGMRLTREDGIILLNSNDLSWLGYLADTARRRACGDYVYFNVNRHINLTNVCIAKCSFCAFGRSANSDGAFAMTKSEALNEALTASEDSDLKELHIVSGLHPDWPFEYYLDILYSIKQRLPYIHIKAFTAVEINHFAKISGLSIRTVLQRLKEAGLNSMPGGGAEIFSPRVRAALCPSKASGAEWLSVVRTAHTLGIPTNASMLYGHIETAEERIDHLLQLRSLQDETHGIQTFVGLAFHPFNTALETKVGRVPAWEDLKMIAVARLLLDNIKNIKAYWVMLTVPVAQLALSFGANDLDGTVNEEKITHAAGGKTAKGLSKELLINLVQQTGRIPVERDSIYNVVNSYQ